jgi:hypothetical protein
MLAIKKLVIKGLIKLNSTKSYVLNFGNYHNGNTQFKMEINWQISKDVTIIVRYAR